MSEGKEALLILGTRPFSLEIADVVSETPGFEVQGFVENLNREKCDETLEGLPIFWIDEVAGLASTHKAICGIGTTHRHRYTKQVEELGMSFATVVHPLARVSKKSSLGQGTLVSVFSVVAAYSTLGKHVLVNRGCIVGHHTTIGDHVSIMIGAIVAGDTGIGDSTYIGMGSVIRNGVTIGSHSIIGAGAVVTKDVPDRVQVVGNPARIVKENIDGL